MERRPRHTTKKTHTTHTTRRDTDRDTQRAYEKTRDGYNKRHVALLAPPTTSSLHDVSYSRRIVVVSSSLFLLVPIHPSFKPYLFPSSLYHISLPHLFTTSFTTASFVHPAFVTASSVSASSVSASSVLSSSVWHPLPRFIFTEGIPPK